MLETVLEHLPSIISSLAVIITAWFAYNQKTKDTITALKVEQFKKEQELRAKQRQEHSNKIFGELWDLLSDLYACRVYITQPHPLGQEHMVSIGYEVTKKGVSPMKPHIQNLPISEVPTFCRSLSDKRFIACPKTSEIEDDMARAIMTVNGCNSVLVYRLHDNKYSWTGSLFVEFTTHQEFANVEEIEKRLKQSADLIQYILPEFI